MNKCNQTIGKFLMGLIAFLVVIGYCLNLYYILSASPVIFNAIFIAQVSGVLLIPLGVILGWLFWFI